MNVAKFDAELEAGAYAWPGGYPRYFVCADGEALSFKAAQDNAEQVREAITGERSDPCWRVVAVAINWEDGDLRCAHTGDLIESAYAEAEAS